jgi:hypothetical protein
MSSSSYQAPQDDLVAHKTVVLTRRPVLIWFTQALILLFLAVSIVVAVLGLVDAPTALSESSARFVGLLLLQICVITGLILLFIGLARRRKWARLGAVVFAAVVLFTFIASRFTTSGPYFFISPEERLGAAVAEITVTLFVFIYPFRLYFSKRVRAFFGIG